MGRRKAGAEWLHCTKTPHGPLICSPLRLVPIRLLLTLHVRARGEEHPVVCSFVGQCSYVLR